MLVGLNAVGLFALVCAGLALDLVLGEPRRAHPLVAFGRLADWIEARFNRGAPGDALKRRLLGVLALSFIVGLPVGAVVTVLAHAPVWAAMSVQTAALYFALGAKSLWQHVHPVGDALAISDLDRARALGARIVTRDLRDASTADVARAAVESALENGNDAVFATLFWFAIAGAPGAVAYRLVNTLDAMWGYKTPRYVYFGWCAARLDDLLNLIPARLTALTYALAGNTKNGLACWRTQAPAWDSPNAGPVMAAGAGALGLELGGTASYHGHVENRPPLGNGLAPAAADVDRALRLVFAGVAAWLALLGLLVLAGGSAHA